MKLMIVDDNKDVRIFLRSLLEDKADEIIECSNGLTAIDLYIEHNPDLVLMDIEMKSMDGITATEKIIQINPEAKIIVITSYTDKKLKESSISAGAIAFVLKDNLTELEEIINKEIQINRGN